MSPASTNSTFARRHGRMLTVAACGFIVVAGAALIAVGRAPAQSLQQRLDATEAQLSEAHAKEGVLTGDIAEATSKIRNLEGEVAKLRNREAVVQAELDRVQAELTAEQDRLEQLKMRLQRAIGVLEARLVEIYKTGEPDLITVILSSDGFDDLLERTEYLQRIEDQDSAIVGRVRTLRDETQATVDRVKAARDKIAAKRVELAETRQALDARTDELAAARSARQGQLSQVREHAQQLEGDLSEISDQIAERLGSGSGRLPAGPIRGGSSGFIWPVNGPVVSGFGMRWGRMHEGIDIAVPTGTPIRAAKAGSIVIAGPTGGYGNYTCISHGGGLSTCYAHQSSFARTSGSVGQGTVIGYVGCTGHCFGPHLHFEVRIGGRAVDPLGYL